MPTATLWKYKIQNEFRRFRAAQLSLVRRRTKRETACCWESSTPEERSEARTGGLLVSRPACPSHSLFRTTAGCLNSALLRILMSIPRATAQGLSITPVTLNMHLSPPHAARCLPAASTSPYPASSRCLTPSGRAISSVPSPAPSFLLLSPSPAHLHSAPV